MLLDTDVLIDALRGHPPAVAWLSGVDAPIGVPGLVAMELIQGCRDLAEQQRVDRVLRRFPTHWPTPSDCQRAYRDFSSYRLSHGVGLLDSLIAATTLGLGETLATFNAKHYRIIPGLTIVQPY